MKSFSKLCLTLLPAIVITAFGCNTGTGPKYADGAVDIRTASLAFAVGDSLVVNITNLSAHNVFYNLCPVFLEERVEGTWLSRGSPSDGFSQSGCEAIAMWLLPGESTVLKRRIPMSVPLGTYRIRFENYRIDGVPLRPTYHLSNTFVIQ
jgi:hypothetical protein